MTTKHAWEGQLGWRGSLVQLEVLLGILLGSGAFITPLMPATRLVSTGFQTWEWAMGSAVPFVASLVLTLLAAYAPVAQALVCRARMALLATGAFVAASAALYILVTAVLGVGLRSLGLDHSSTLMAAAIVGGGQLITIVVFALISGLLASAGSLKLPRVVLSKTPKHAAGASRSRGDGSVGELWALIDKTSQVAAIEERNRLARELHDSVCQALFSMTLQSRALELAVQRTSQDPDGRIVGGLAELRELTQSALTEMRALVFQLRSPAVHEEGLAAAVQRHAAAVAARGGVDIRVHAPKERLLLDEPAEHELFRIVQEALNNSLKHADPRHIDIRLNQDVGPAGGLTVEIADDGVGFDTHESRPGHLGLESMRERAERLGGRLTVDSSPAGSTTVRAVLPASRGPELESGTAGAPPGAKSAVMSDAGCGPSANRAMQGR
jgi:signal transduction histidine kinase